MYARQRPCKTCGQAGSSPALLASRGRRAPISSRHRAAQPPPRPAGRARPVTPPPRPEDRSQRSGPLPNFCDHTTRSVDSGQLRCP